MPWKSASGASSKMSSSSSRCDTALRSPSVGPSAIFRSSTRVETKPSQFLARQHDPIQHPRPVHEALPHVPPCHRIAARP
ncbi:hypothetical protein SPRG_19440 [Saprolegnia parasitica CBS 223.65]|uniref:Uncharacterized protein n=1 Tax=Saprolegnia parasitica (strain CBS 223.65) TaxID=695850 RepID=A0A067CR10_SAPPC|nr:hypothetical protein SPRG_19440 [Saprolegnia parasitica CBS 223.65]KDO32958.1 hypothetical protein SPRG_19440 [Saprolegnia parasitica CBS 223.65]|eukprot:XP_012196669.1 hypothetical protein SPRG_19440 [Saprolegnia parasitica CBS 223.65]